MEGTRRLIEAASATLDFFSELQTSFAKLRKSEMLELEGIRNVCGVDVAYSKDRAYAASVLLNLKSDKIVEKAEVGNGVPFPYFPTLLFMREGPLIVKAVESLSTRPDLVLVDGHGIAHPRKAGLAVFVGVILNLPCVGIAKSLLAGRIVKVKAKAREIFSPIFLQASLVGFQVRPKDSRIFYVSPGHKVRIKDLKPLIGLMNNNYPNALREAHDLAIKKMKEDAKY